MGRSAPIASAQHLDGRWCGPERARRASSRPGPNVGVMAFAHDLWERFGRLRLDDVPDDVVTVAKQCILDWFGCALAGSATEVAEIVRDVVATAPGSSSIVASPVTCPAGQAALANGAMGHALDFDDTHLEMGGHPTAPVWPAVFAVGEELGACGA